MRVLLVNAFSINMLAGNRRLSFHKVENPSEFVGTHHLVGNAIGHADTDRVVRGVLEGGGAPPIMEGKRVTVTFDGSFDALLVAQYSGPRLPEGATSLPEGARIDFWVVL